MSYEDWETPFQEFFNDIPELAFSEQYNEDFDIGRAEALFEVGFTMHSDELEAAGYSPGEVNAIREEFFDYMGIDDYEFDWEGWREAMGYD